MELVPYDKFTRFSARVKEFLLQFLARAFLHERDASRPIFRQDSNQDDSLDSLEKSHFRHGSNSRRFGAWFKIKPFWVTEGRKGRFSRDA
jgi:hypothetical protein